MDIPELGTNFLMYNAGNDILQVVGTDPGDRYYAWLNNFTGAYYTRQELIDLALQWNIITISINSQPTTEWTGK